MAEFTSRIQPDSACSVLGGCLRLARKEFWRQCGCNAISKPLALPYELTPCRHAFICVRFGRVTCGRTTRKTNVPMPVWQAKIIRIKAFMYFLYRKSDIFATKP